MPACWKCLLLLPFILVAGNAAAAGFSGSWAWDGPNEVGSRLKTIQDGATVRFQLELSRGAPSYNSGFIEGRFALNGSEGVFSATDDGDCEIHFRFPGKSVQLRQSPVHRDCGFGGYPDGTLRLKSRKTPTFSKGDPRTSDGG
jgi:hypothetical protein